MPYVSITTNVSVNAQTLEALLAELTESIVSNLNKPKEYVQVAVNGNQPMQFGGTVGPTAFVELRALGLSDDLAGQVSPVLADIIHDSLSIPVERIFLNLLDVPRSRWGWNGSTFG